MASPTENQLKSIETGSSYRKNLDPILNQPKIDFGIVDDLDVRVDGSFDIKKFLDSKIDSTNP